MKTIQIESYNKNIIRALLGLKVVEGEPDSPTQEFSIGLLLDKIFKFFPWDIGAVGFNPVGIEEVFFLI